MVIGIKFSINELTSGSQRTIANNLIVEIIKAHSNVIIFTTNPSFFSGDNFPKVKIVKIKGFHSGIPFVDIVMSRIYDQLFFEKVASQHKVSVVYCPYNGEAVFRMYKIPQILTVHDLIPILFPEQFPKMKFFWKYFNIPAIRNAARITTVSQNSKNDIVVHLNINEDKISVINNGYVPLDRSVNGRAEDGLSNILPEEPYFFYLASTLYPYKNLNTFLTAFQQFQIDNHGFKLVIVGRMVERFKEGILRIFERVSGDLIFFERVSDEVLSIIYSNASGVIYPSLYEGFGIPPLEAMSFGIPVAASNTSSIPEVCGDAAIYFDPSNVAQIAEAMANLLEPDNRRNLVNNGYKQIENFSWVKAGEAIVNLCKKTINEH